MKQIIILSLLSLLFPFSGSAKQVKTCRLDQRPFTERTTDYRKVVEYPSGYSEANTRYSADKIDYKGETLLVDYSPLCDFEEISKALVRDNAPFGKEMRADNPSFLMQDSVKVLDSATPLFHCKRDFIATWIIRDDQLYLADVWLYTPDMLWYRFRKARPIYYGALPVQINPPKEEIRKRLEKAIRRKFDDNQLIFADWFSGTLIGETDKKENSNSKDKQAVSIQIKNGKVESIQSKKLKTAEEITKGVLVRPVNEVPYLFFEEARKTWETE